MDETIPDQQSVKIYIRYKRLCEINLKAEKRLAILQKKRSEINPDIYRRIKKENENIVAEITPLIKELRPEMEAFVLKLKNKKDQLKTDLVDITKPIQQYKKLYKADLIDKEQYKKGVKPLKRKISNLKDELKIIEKQLSDLK